MDTTVIFKEADRHQTEIYEVQGCEKTIVVRSDAPFTLNITSQSRKDSHQRPFNIMGPITASGDYYLPCIVPGMLLIFQIDGGIDPNAHLFVEICNECCE